MANKSVFASVRGRLLPGTDDRNQAGAPAYGFDAPHALAQYAASGTIHEAFYTSAEQQLADVLKAAAACDPLYVAQTAIYARQKGHMKDMPALLLAHLSGRDPAMFARAFGRVIDNGRMLRTFVQIMRSGAVGRKSLGTRPKRMVQDWLCTASDRALLHGAIGRDPSLADVIKMVHPKAGDDQRNALFAWLIGKPADTSKLPPAVQDYIRLRDTGGGPIPDVPFQMLTALALSAKDWAAIARQGGWHMVRMNLRTFARHGVFELEGMANTIAHKLRDPEAIARARVMPHQILMAHSMADQSVPAEVRLALEDALDIALSNIPSIEGSVALCIDVSGSMSMPATGYRHGATSAVRCIDVAALMAAGMMRANPGCVVVPFDHAAHRVSLSPRDTVMTNARLLSQFLGGATNCSAALAQLTKDRIAPDLVVFVSDNQSWVDARTTGRASALMAEWQTLKHRNPDARMACIDIAPYATSQAPDRDDIVNIGGFTDAVFDTLADFVAGRHGTAHWVSEIRAIDV